VRVGRSLATLGEIVLVLLGPALARLLERLVALGDAAGALFLLGGPGRGLRLDLGRGGLALVRRLAGVGVALLAVIGDERLERAAFCARCCSATSWNAFRMSSFELVVPGLDAMFSLRCWKNR
jgi:hypothetical protein